MKNFTKTDSDGEARTAIAWAVKVESICPMHYTIDC